MTVTITNQTKNSVSLTSQQKQNGNVVLVGNPIGLLLSLTYANFIGTVLANQTKNLATLTNQTKS